MTRRLAPLFLSLAALAAGPSGANPPETLVDGALLTGWQTPEGTHMTGLRLTLAPDWKTYWRAPGDAGIPPLFDWTGSENVAGVRLHWPRPSVFHLNGMQSIGYHDNLVLPIEVIPADPSKPVNVKLSVDMGVCRDICVPASVSVGGDLVTPGAADAAIAAALADQPERATARATCAIEPIADGLRVTATLDMPPVGPEETVVFETGREGVWVAESTEERRGAQLVAVTELVPPEGAPFALDRSQLVMTVIGPDRAVEIRGCPAP
jgi:DsbC/DsbD-like thiol-disulfide interchange protein